MPSEWIGKVVKNCFLFSFYRSKLRTEDKKKRKSNSFNTVLQWNFVNRQPSHPRVPSGKVPSMFPPSSHFSCSLPSPSKFSQLGIRSKFCWENGKLIFPASSEVRIIINSCFSPLLKHIIYSSARLLHFLTAILD